jgi:hypothetical protein
MNLQLIIPALMVFSFAVFLLPVIRECWCVDECMMDDPLGVAAFRFMAVFFGCAMLHFGGIALGLFAAAFGIIEVSP